MLCAGYIAYIAGYLAYKAASWRSLTSISLYMTKNGHGIYRAVDEKKTETTGKLIRKLKTLRKLSEKSNTQFISHSTNFK